MKKYIYKYLRSTVATCIPVLFNLTYAIASEDHSHHHMHMPTENARSIVEYKIPAILMTKIDGKKENFLASIKDEKPVFLNFIYTTCTAVCPVMTHTFSTFEKNLANESKNIHLVSVSIDPEQDTPSRLKEYSKSYEAGSNWIFYTGSIDASIAVQKSFSAYHGDKMNHTPLTLIRPSPGKPWIRIDGFATPDDLMHEYKQLIQTK